VLQRVGTKAYEAAGADESGDGSGGDGGAGADGGDGAEAPSSEDEGETIEGEYKEV